MTPTPLSATARHSADPISCRHKTFRLPFPKTLLLILFVGAVQIHFYGIAAARVVGLVVDDSGSMAQRFETPLYAAQLLISVLGGGDRLFVTRLSEQGLIQEINLNRRSAHMESMRNNWVVIENTPTPYLPVEGLLDRLKNETKTGESASLLVVTDGMFSEQGLPQPSQLPSHYEAIRKQFRGDSLQAFFMAFAPHGAKGEEVLHKIKKQQVRENLLRVFNGSEDVGSVVVRDGSQLYGALMDIIAQMVGVDPRQSGDVLDLQDKTLKLAPPFTITRLVSMSSGTREVPAARLAGEDFQTREKEAYDASMRKADDLTRSVLSAHINHLIPWPPLTAGQSYTLTFDRPLRPSDIRVLFETSVKVDWEVYDQDGAMLPVGQGGVIEIPQGAKIKVRAFLLETTNGKDERVDFSRLRHRPEFGLHSQGQGQASDTSRMDLDMATNSAIGALRFAAPGRYTVAVTARYPGFINKRARDLTVVVKEETPVRIALAAKGAGACPQCTADRIELTYTIEESPQDVLLIEVSTSAAKPGEYELALSEALPNGVKILLPDGKALEKGLFGKPAVSCGAGTTAGLRVQYNKAFRETSEKAVSLTACAKPPFKGEATLGLRFVPMVAGLSLEPGGSTIDPSGREPFRLKVTALDERQGVFVKVLGLQAPLEAKHLKLEGEDLPFIFEVQEKTNLVLVMPQKKWWCDCLTPAGEHPFEVSYLHPETKQQAVYKGKVELTPVGLWARCWQEILGTILAILILLKIRCLSRTHRFPRRSRLDVRRAGDSWSIIAPRLHKWYDWIWPICGDARRTVEGFHFVAGPNCVFLTPAEYADGLICDGGPAHELFDPENPRPYKLVWGGVITSTEEDREYRLIRDYRSSREEESDI